MIRFALRRLLWTIPTIFLITFLVFVAIRIGTNPVQAYLRLNPRATQDKIDQFRRVNGLNGNIVNQYFRWLGHFLRFDWGRSIKGSRPVWPSLKAAMANTLVLGGPASFVGIVIGAEQWPDCLNPITACANSSWYVWTTAFKVLPSVWATTAKGTYEATQLVTGEPTVALG